MSTVEIATAAILVAALLVVLVALFRERDDVEAQAEEDDDAVLVGYDTYGAPLYLHQIDTHGRE